MSKSSHNSLVKLSNETKELVNQGVFSLYSLDASEASDQGAVFVLYTSKHSYLLSDAGEVVKQYEPSVRFKVMKSISFPEIVPSPIRFGKINIA